jgi:hypothetical protein
MTSLERANWNTELSWIKAHVGIAGNDLTDWLAKAATSVSDDKIVFNRLPMSILNSKIQKETKLKCQGMGRVYKGQNKKNSSFQGCMTGKS